MTGLSRKGFGVLLLLLIGAVAFAAVQSLIKVTWNGVTVSERARVIDGTLYIPAIDLAKAYGATVKFEKGSSTAEILGSGGAGQRAGNVVKGGEWATVEGFRFYFDAEPQYDSTDGVWRLRGKVRNALAKQQFIGLEYGKKLHILQNVKTGQNLRDAFQYMVNETSGATLQQGEEANLDLIFEGSAAFASDPKDLKAVLTFDVAPNSFDHGRKMVVRVVWSDEEV